MQPQYADGTPVAEGDRIRYRQGNEWLTGTVVRYSGTELMILADHDGCYYEPHDYEIERDG